MSVLREVRMGVVETFAAMREPELAAWALYLALGPVYLWSSGLPQPGDWVLLLLGPLVFRGWNGKLSNTAVSTLRPLILFVVYGILINLAWSVIENAWSLGLKRGFGVSFLFYLYNTLAFVTFLLLHRRYGRRLLEFTSHTILGALVVQAVFAFAIGGGAGRETLLFNNPNQLGYFALLSINILFLLHRKGYTSTLAVAVGGVAAAYLALISASKAALAGILLIAAVGALIRLRTLLVVGVVFGLTFALAAPMRNAVDGAIARYEAHDTSPLEDRGYDRITDYPEYWLFGSGEGGYNRFRYDSALGAHEIHSSAGTLFFCYGLIGTLLFVTFLWRVMKGGGLRSWMLIAPSLAYGMAHQGLRTTMFWVLLALVVTLREQATARRFL